MTGKGPTRSAVIPLGLSDPHSPFPAWFNSWANSPNLCCARSCEEHRESLYLPGKSTVFCSGNSVTSCRQLIWRKFLPILPFARTASLCMFLPSLPTFGWCATWANNLSVVNCRCVTIVATKGCATCTLHNNKWRRGRTATQVISGSRVNVTEPCATFLAELAQGYVAGG